MKLRESFDIKKGVFVVTGKGHLDPDRFRVLSMDQFSTKVFKVNHIIHQGRKLTVGYSKRIFY
jgi:hypothetical protein